MLNMYRQINNIIDLPRVVQCNYTRTCKSFTDVYSMKYLHRDLKSK